MNYSAVYCALIEKRRQNPLEKTGDGTVESHHIIPRSEGGDNSSANIVNLTLREHYIAHLLLAKIYKDWKMLNAIRFMRQVPNTNSRLFEKLKLLSITKGHPYWFKKGNPHRFKKGNLSWTGKKLSEEHKEKIRRWALSRTPMSEETKKKMSIAHKGKPSWIKGKHHSEETKRKLSIANKGRKLSATAIEHSIKARRKPIEQYTQSGEFVGRYDSIRQAAKAIGVCPQALSSCLRGRHKTALGYIWRYAEVNSNAEKN